MGIWTVKNCHAVVNLKNIDDAWRLIMYRLKKKVGQVETGLTHPLLWMSGKSKKVEPAGRVYFPLPNLSRKIKRDSARRVQ